MTQPILSSLPLQGGSPPLTRPASRPLLSFLRYLRPSCCGHPSPGEETTLADRAKALGIDVRCLTRLYRNALKAYAEQGASPILADVLPQPRFASSLVFFYGAFSDIGRRPSLEDDFVYRPLPDGFFAGVFDGHGDKKKIAAYLSARFYRTFAKALQRNGSDIALAFEQTCTTLQNKVVAQGFKGGSTVLACYAHRGAVFTCTLGDSQAKIYRQRQDEIVSLPLSCVRHWNSAKDACRMDRALGKEEIDLAWLEADARSRPRFPSSESGVNVSRSIGDVRYTLWNGRPAVIQKPKCSFHSLMPGDLLVLACDGLWDEMKSDNALVETVLKPSWDKKASVLADKIGRFALRECASQDNVTVLAVQVQVSLGAKQIEEVGNQSRPSRLVTSP